jgi:ADP-L-glycero-D-manno-heptose 6-epimerase
MNTEKILLTGAAGFIGSYVLGYLNRCGYEQVIIVDDFSDEDKWWNLDEKNIWTKLKDHNFLIGCMRLTQLLIWSYTWARTDTTEFDYAIHEKWNVAYSKEIWNYCAKKIFR